MRTFAQYIYEAKKTLEKSLNNPENKLHTVLKNYGYKPSIGQGGANYVHPHLGHTASISDAGWTHSEKCSPNTSQTGKGPASLDHVLSKVHQGELFEDHASEHELRAPSHKMLTDQGFNAHSRRMKDAKTTQWVYKHPTSPTTVHTFVNPSSKNQQVQHWVNKHYIDPHELKDAVHNAMTPAKSTTGDR